MGNQLNAFAKGPLSTYLKYQGYEINGFTFYTKKSKMSHGDGPPPIFEGDDFPYWKIRMEAYLEALDVGVLRAASQGFSKPKDSANLQGERSLCSFGN